MVTIEENYFRVQQIASRNTQGTTLQNQTQDIAFMLEGESYGGDYYVLEGGTYNTSLVQDLQNAITHSYMKKMARVKMEQANGFNLQIPNMIPKYFAPGSSAYIDYKDKSKVEEISNVIDFIELNSNAYSTSPLTHTSGERTSFADYFKNVKARRAQMNNIYLFYVEPKANVARVATIERKESTTGGNTSVDYMATIHSSVDGEDSVIDVDFLSHNLTDLRDVVR